jgi:small subunit ribosomal protein S20
MANHPSTEKRRRQSLKRKGMNSMNRNKLKTQMRRLKAAITAGQNAEAKTLLPETISLIDKSVQKGVIKKNTAQRYKSRLTKSINAIPAA